MENTPISLIAAVRDFFGYKSAQAFMAEWRKLSPSDKADLKAGLEAVGYNIKVGA